MILCSRCLDREATCIGAYEGASVESPACDRCCAHGNEDGRCLPIEAWIRGKLSERDPNELLNAAAPELLAACREFVRKCECGEASSRRSYAQMKAAIAKAEGR